MITLPESPARRRSGPRNAPPHPVDLQGRLSRCLARCAPSRPAVLAHLEVAGAWDVKDAGGCAAIKDLRETVASTLAGMLDDGVPFVASGLCGFTLLLEGRRPAAALREIRELKHAVDDLCFTWHGHPFRLWVHAGVLELGRDQAPAGRWLSRAREACAVARDLAGEGIQVVEFNDHAWSDIARRREWVQHLSEIIG